MKQEKQIMEQEKEQEKRTEKKGQPKLSKAILVGALATVFAATSLVAAGCKQPTGPDTEINNKGNGNGNGNGNGQEEENNGGNQTGGNEEVGGGDGVDEGGTGGGGTGVTVTFPNPSNITNFGKNIALVSGGNSVIDRVKGSSSMSDATYGEAMGVSDELLWGLTKQSRALETFFGGVEVTNSTELSGLFNTLATAEGNMQGKANETTMVTFRDTMNSNRTTIVDGIKGMLTDEQRGQFDKYFDAYKQLNYLITRDWQTAPGALETARSGYITARTATGDTQLTTITGDYGNGRGTTIEDIGGNQGMIELQLNTLEDKIKELVVGGLGLDGVEHANAMVNALIIQLGQDAEELRAFVDDVEAKNLTYDGVNALDTLLCNEGDIANFASVAPQSSVRLAHVDAGNAGVPGTFFLDKFLSKNVRQCRFRSVILG
jgi:hypothetical protein